MSLCWNSGTYTCKTSDALYALNNEADSEGLVNQDIYVAFNRVVYLGVHPERTGAGVSSVTVAPN